MRVSVELVPRSEEDLQAQLRDVVSLGTVDTVNIPDIARFSLRAWQCCAPAMTHVRHAIPHLVASAYRPDEPLASIEELVRSGVSEVLVVGGDEPGPHGECGGMGALELIRRLCAEHPGLAVYGALDPYRQGFRAEREYALEKLDAGAAGLFTQPFFDVRLMEVFAELLDGIEIFWGATSVTSKGSVRYWRNRNRAVFPAGFEPTLEWNRRFARDAYEFVRERDGNIYFMPIRASISEYLSGIV